jgi:hypothetical protein
MNRLFALLCAVVAFFFSLAASAQDGYVLVSIEVKPSPATIVIGSSLQYSAIGVYYMEGQENLRQDVSPLVGWFSTDESVAILTGSGMAIGVAAGNSTIGATLGDVQGSTRLDVISADLLSVDVTPTDPAMHVGVTQQFAAVGNFSDGIRRDLTRQITWSSSSNSVMTISDAPDSRGLAQAVSVGTSTISAMWNGVTGTTMPTVPPGPAPLVLQVDDGVDSVSYGSTLNFVVTLTNNGADTANVTVSGEFSLGLDNVHWSCVTIAGVACTESGSGIFLTDVTLPPGQAAVWLATALIVDDARVGTAYMRVSVPGAVTVTDTDTFFLFRNGFD